MLLEFAATVCFYSPRDLLCFRILKPSLGMRFIGTGLVYFAHGLINLLPQHPDLPRRGYAQPDLVSADTDDCHHDIVTDGKTLAGSATQYQHGIFLERSLGFGLMLLE